MTLTTLNGGADGTRTRQKHARSRENPLLSHYLSESLSEFAARIETTLASRNRKGAD